MSSHKHLFRVRGYFQSVDDDGNSVNDFKVDQTFVTSMGDGEDVGEINRIQRQTLTLTYSSGNTYAQHDIENPGDIGFGSDIDAVGNDCSLDAGSNLPPYDEGPVTSVWIRNTGSYDCYALVGPVSSPANGDFLGTQGNDGGAGTSAFVLHAGGIIMMTRVKQRTFSGPITVDGFQGRYLLFTDPDRAALSQNGTTLEIVLGGRVVS